MELFGTKLTKSEFYEKFGHISQVGGIKSSTLNDGKADGVRCLSFSTGTGLNFDVLTSRAMDIGHMSYKGVPIGFISKTGVVNGNFYETDYDGFHRTFFAGLLTTCGLRNIGATCEDGESLGLHGRISNIPAEQVSYSCDWDGDDLILTAQGKTTESKLYGENLQVTRKIVTKMGSSIVNITDEIENLGFLPEPLTVLYHLNFGYPLLSSETELFFPDGEVYDRNTRQASKESDYKYCSEPQVTYPETVFYHKRKGGDDGYSYATIYNKEVDIGVNISYKVDTLPYLTQWKNMAKGDYVLALEPCNCYPDGRVKIRDNDMLTYINPGETKKMHFSLEIGNGRSLFV